MMRGTNSSIRRLSELREAADFDLCLPTQDVPVDWSTIQQLPWHKP